METACSFEADVTQQDVSAFAQLSGDRNPLHVDPSYARTTEYGRPIVHGALLLGLVSRVLGMHIPGRRSVLLSVKAQFPKPLFYPGRVKVEGLLKSFNAERNVGVVRVVMTELSKLWTVLEAEASFALHSTNHSEPAPEASHQPDTHAVSARETDRRTSTRPCLLVTGGTGGIGSRLVQDLSEQYDICCVTRQSRSANGSSRVSYEQVDVEAEGALEAYLNRQAPEFYGLIHLSVPPVPRGFVSDDLAMVKRHLRHGVEVPLLLAKWARQPGSRVKRVILCGSTFGSKYPKTQLGAYALGKAAMEYLPRLLTADLAAQGATVNIITPTVVPVGLNEGMSERARAILIGKMPTRRLVDAHDISGVAQFLLSEAAAQINGVAIAVDGGVAEGSPHRLNRALHPRSKAARRPSARGPPWRTHRSRKSLPRRAWISSGSIWSTAPSVRSRRSGSSRPRMPVGRPACRASLRITASRSSGCSTPGRTGSLCPPCRPRRKLSA